MAIFNNNASIRVICIIFINCKNNGMTQKHAAHSRTPNFAGALAFRPTPIRTKSVIT
jgi:hypothetical protein